MSLNTVGSAVGTVARVAPGVGVFAAESVSVPAMLSTVGTVAVPVVVGVAVIGICFLGLCMVHKDRKGWAGLKCEISDGSKFHFGFGLE